MQLSSMKLSRTSTKKMLPPAEEGIEDNAIVQQYCNRTADVADLSMLEWARMYVIGSATGKQHNGKALVAVRYNYIYNDKFFFQDLVMNFPFQNLNDLQDCA